MESTCARSLAAGLAALVALGCTSEGERNDGGRDAAADAAPEACSMVGCRCVFEIYLDLPTTYQALRGSTVAICRNDDCASGDFFCLPDPPVVGEGRACLLSSVVIGGREVQADAHVLVRSDGTMYVGVTWDPYAPGDYATDGDVYRVTIRDGADQIVVDHEEVVGSYEISWPNGPTCPPTCRSVTLDRRANTDP